MIEIKHTPIDQEVTMDTLSIAYLNMWNYSLVCTNEIAAEEAGYGSCSYDRLEAYDHMLWLLNNELICARRDYLRKK